MPACVIAAVLLAACTSTADPAPSSSPQAAPSPSVEATAPPAEPSPSASPAAPSLPPEAEGRSKAAAKAFVRHYVDVLNYAASTGIVGPLRALSGSGCASCDSIARNVDEVYRDGGQIRGAGWSVKEIRALSASRRSSLLSVIVDISPEIVVAEQGAKPTRNSGGRQPMTIMIVRGNAAWVVDSLDLVT